MDIFEILYSNRNEELAIPMAKYMKDQFPFLGIKKQERVFLIKEFLKEKKKEGEIDWDFIFNCFDVSEREFQYLAIDYMNMVKELFMPDDMETIEKLIKTKSWWDSVDSLSSIVGHIALKYPEVKEGIISKWVKSDNIWLKRV